MAREGIKSAPETHMPAVGCLALLVLLGGFLIVAVGLISLFWRGDVLGKVFVIAAGVAMVALSNVAIKKNGKQWAETAIPDGFSAPAAPPPPAAAARAEQAGFGDLIATRKDANQVANFVLALGGAAASVAAFFLLAWLAISLQARGVAMLALAPLLLAVTLVFVALAALTRTPVHAYLYTGGMLLRRRGRTHLVAWNQVDRLLISRRAGAYHLTAVDGKRFRIQGRPGEQVRDQFGEVLCAAVQQYGRPIVKGDARGDWRP
ncbi:DUF6585 family protein [Micromonospora sp. NPDC049044]|uniref:DUF6585 family protein n=1 Tax=unclassified Micromonospora TaxID=2617518 RepID=UPI0033CD6DE6